MHSTSGVCVCCLASNGTSLYGMMMYEANEATQTHCYNPVAPAYPIWAYYVHLRQRRCQEDPVSLPSGRLEKTIKSCPYHVSEHHPTGSETTPYAPRSSRFGSEPPSMEATQSWVACQKRRRRLVKFFGFLVTFWVTQFNLWLAHMIGQFHIWFYAEMPWT